MSNESPKYSIEILVKDEDEIVVMKRNAELWEIAEMNFYSLKREHERYLEEMEAKAEMANKEEEEED